MFYTCFEHGNDSEKSIKQFVKVKIKVFTAF